jgi:hypothetical protein
MKRGVNTLDALFAILMIFSLVALLQNYTTVNFNSVEEYGGETQAKSMATSIGSQMNSLYAINPGPKDYLDTSKSSVSARIFAKEPTITITKANNNPEVSVELYAENYYTSDYPVAKSIAYSDPKVIK